MRACVRCVRVRTRVFTGDIEPVLQLGDEVPFVVGEREPGHLRVVRGHRLRAAVRGQEHHLEGRLAAARVAAIVVVVVVWWLFVLSARGRAGVRACICARNGILYILLLLLVVLYAATEGHTRTSRVKRERKKNGNREH